METSIGDQRRDRRDPTALARWFWVVMAGFVVVAVAAIAVTRIGGGEVAPAAASDPPAELPTVEQVPGPVPSAGTPTSDVEPGTAAVGPGGKTYGALPTDDIPAGADPAEMAPDYMTILSTDGSTIAGYVKRDDLYPASGAPGLTDEAPGIPVYAADGVTVVGEYVLNKGFVASGTDAADVPDLTATGGRAEAGGG